MSHPSGVITTAQLDSGQRIIIGNAIAVRMARGGGEIRIDTIGIEPFHGNLTTNDVKLNPGPHDSTTLVDPSSLMQILRTCLLETLTVPISHMRPYKYTLVVQTASDGHNHFVTEEYVTWLVRRALADTKYRHVQVMTGDELDTFYEWAVGLAPAKKRRKKRKAAKQTA